MLITCPHLAWGTVSNPLSKEDGVNISCLAWVNSTKSEGQDIYYRLEAYQTQTRHLSITWLTCCLSDHGFNLEWPECTKDGGTDGQFYFQTDAVVLCKTGKQNEQTSITGKCFSKVNRTKMLLYIFSLLENVSTPSPTTSLFSSSP